MALLQIESEVKAKSLLCSSCNEKHPIDSRPCFKCYPTWCCPKCGARNDSGRWTCPCGFHFAPAEEVLKLLAHPACLSRCPKCGRKLRVGPRDKNRAMGLKS